MPIRRLSKEPEEMLKIEANPAPTNDPTVVPRLFIDMNRANSVPSIPGGHNCPDNIKNGMNLFSHQEPTTPNQYSPIPYYGAENIRISSAIISSISIEMFC